MGTYHYQTQFIYGRGKEDSFINARASTRSLNTNFKKSFDGAIVNFITPGVLE